MSVRFSQPVPELLEVVSSHDEVARFVGRSDFLECAQARLDLGNRRDGRKALACGGITVALYVETHEEAPRFGLIHPVLPLFDLAAECYLDEHRNVHSTRSRTFMPGNSWHSTTLDGGLDEFRGVWLSRASSSSIRARACASSPAARASAACDLASSVCREATSAASTSSPEPASSAGTPGRYSHPRSPTGDRRY